MRTKYISAIVMLLAGGMYCLLGIYYQIPLMDFTIQLLIVLLIFWIIGGILRMVLDRFMGEIKVNTNENPEKTGSEEAETADENEESEEDEIEEDKQTEEE